MVRRAAVPINEAKREAPSPASPDATPRTSLRQLAYAVARVPASIMDQKASEVQHALRNLHLLIRSERLYEKDHPLRLDSLDSAYDSIRSVTELLGGLEIRVERGGLVAPRIGDAHLPDSRGEMQALAADLQRAGIHALAFLKKFHVGELDTLSRLVKASLLKSEDPANGTGNSWWPARLLENRVEGISINTQTERRVDTVLASLIGALVAYGGHSPREKADLPIQPPDFDDLVACLRLLAQLTPPLESARGLSPEEAARAIHGAMEEASRDSVCMLLSSVSQYGPREGERPQPYLLRLSENIIFEFLGAEFSSGSLTASSVRPTISRLSDVIVEAGGYSGPHSSQHLSSLAVTWATDTHREQLIDKFWLELPPREKSAVLRGPDVWCVPVAALRHTLGQLAEAGADAPRREARNIVLNYARRIEHAEACARRFVAAGLNELSSIIESLWPNQLPEDLSRGAMKALDMEKSPETAALLAAFVESLGRIAVNRGDYSGFETILTGLERAPHDKEHDHVSALAHRLVAQDRWLLLADAALANRPLDPVLPRLLQRDPERLLDRMTLLLTEPRGPEMVPAMARLLRTIGVPVLNLLETRLYEARRQRVTAAIKLLAAADPERLLRGLTRAMASWEWNLQDLAVSELSRPSNSSSALSTAFVFSAILADAHPMVVPMMIDQLGLAQETTAVSQLMEIAAGEHEVLRDQFVRIKAIEALGRMRASEAAELLRKLAENREGLTYVEPAGLRAAAEDALALIENRPSFKQAAAAFGAPGQSSSGYVIPRRYTRVPLESPLRAQIEGAPAGLSRVKTISLGGAYLESPGKLAIGDSIKLEVRAGLRKINFTAVVRNIGPDGSGIEFVHMRDEDREKLRKLVQRHLQL
ncbi:MAG TPA: PilZ domain-containing protein [Candidatus Polarisedimenticolia bacterium]|nr:PilZ domain-containing protein [Candidatus Polarisedimenticolia bacterium]